MLYYKAVITKAGWNSAKTSPTRPVCHDSVLVTEAEQARYLKPSWGAIPQQIARVDLASFAGGPIKSMERDFFDYFR